MENYSSGGKTNIENYSFLLNVIEDGDSRIAVTGIISDHFNFITSNFYKFTTSSLPFFPLTIHFLTSASILNPKEHV